MQDEIVELKEDISGSPLYSEDLAPVPASKRTWSMWNLAFIWVGMAVCIPTYLLASYMIKSGLSWISALVIIAAANLVITLPMVLNGHAGVKYGIPFPVLGRASFGTNGIHLASVVRAIVACGWFGVQTWIGGLAFYAIFNAATGSEGSLELDAGKFIGFIVFWFINMYFVWKGTESIKWLEEYSAPILILMGILLIVWGGTQAGGFGIVLKQSEQLQKPTVVVEHNSDEMKLTLNPIKGLDGKMKADQFRLEYKNGGHSEWIVAVPNAAGQATFGGLSFEKGYNDGDELSVRVRKQKEDGSWIESSAIPVPIKPEENPDPVWWTYLFWFTGMVGFWATMSLSISDITRYTHSQKSQIRGQFIGLPGTMILYSFVGIFVTCAAVVNFEDVLISEDAPWDPVSLLAKFESPVVVIIAQIFMLIATLSTNIAANVIAPANAFSNLMPKKISFKAGGTITGIVGILICPWWLMNDISEILVFVSGLLGPVLGILLCDYFVLRKKTLKLAELYKTKGEYSYGGSGFNPAAMIALAAGVLVALVGFWVPALGFLFTLSWFTGFFVAFGLYWVLMRGKVKESLK
jgi:cytosine/uracil/thiamine/allantoin permease